MNFKILFDKINFSLGSSHITLYYTKTAPRVKIPFDITEIMEKDTIHH
jgi:hypothetical protein